MQRVHPDSVCRHRPSEPAAVGLQAGFSVAFAAALTVCGSDARAESPVPVTLDFITVQGCPTESEFRREVEARTARVQWVPVAGQVSWRVHFSRVGTSFEARLAVANGLDQPTQRRLQSASCAELARGMSFIAALTIDPLSKPPSVDSQPSGSLVDGGAGVPLGPAPPLPPVAPAIAPAKVEPLRVVPYSKFVQTETLTVPLPLPAVVGPDSADTLRWGIEVRAAADFLVLPNPVWGGVFAVRADEPWWLLEFGVALHASAGYTVDTVALPADLAATRFLGLADFCVPRLAFAEVFALFPCVSTRAGAAFASISRAGVTSGQSAVYPLVSLALGARLEVNPLPSFGLALSGGPQLQLLPPRFREGTVVLYEAGPIAADVAFSVFVRP